MCIVCTDWPSTCVYTHDAFFRMALPASVIAGSCLRASPSPPNLLHPLQIEDNSLGSPPSAKLMSELKPRFWFSAHMHTQFAAVVQHGSAVPGKGPPPTTKFLALDKCLPGKRFLQASQHPPTWCRAKHTRINAGGVAPI